MQKSFRTREQMYPIVESFSSSGQTHKEYCNSLGIKYGTYKYWCRKYRSENDVKDSVSKSSNFISLDVTSPIAVALQSLEIHYPNGVRLRLDTNLDANGYRSLKKLLVCLD
jgi:hypothetical protein